ncbi:L-glyceraldehyde 3-phosphate reductase [Streptomyces europaeiscabiei]|uniref:L-glyceraldehyde 3-phosphate reductase n=1 Tax=Streptomyces europaeiscabiei TaxID=146819 RepID=A0ABU4NI20_9ACTN|nr:L-glyceraldehyde 3-phosphate reductase [Streptomyces europaeiscabiei]MDX2526474.1 L-glyceraldehyde 3-phosphate reductase [Streptomyces europaeiscabiei]MDX2762934.1 L-glyceraldehyde 3-phosphate reductase [Streptomyces europaeiscabiei]MDX2773646.1 L-glyceraldehyde 3-phosphate reductase [Streptomyces europaeiscabiei]MDX3544064.1 L-glyceraldehyde 3-phosphate reductase [Streptomyces europaeiscabiei]MDX3552298.1 L-glyceraldehyde 3-phosphate reductase [Streptomyces europaeiscabiei]
MYTAHPDRYADMPYRRTGRSGLKLPALSLGLWHNFGPDRSVETQRAILRRAFDLGVTHFDLANNYGPPPGSAESALGEALKADFAPYRDELIISTKAGYLMWPGPYGEWGSRKYVLSSLDQSLKRMGLDHVDIFYSHRPDPETPLEETMGALHSAVQQGKALYVGVSNYSAEQTREAARILGELGTPLLIHQPRYSMLDRRPESEGLLDALDELQVGSIVFSPLEQGLLTSRYLDGIPEGSRAASDSPFLKSDAVTEDLVGRLRALDEVAKSRGQTLAQLALAWTLRGGRVTSALVGASSARQIEDSVGAIANLDFEADELAGIDAIIEGKG